MKTINSFILTCFLMLISCKDDDLPKLCDDSFVGDWRWKKTEGGLTGQVLTPKNTGEERRLEISDSTWKEFLNGTLILDQPYTFTQDTTSLFYSGRIHFEDSSRIFVTVNTCSLFIESGWHDTPVVYYERKE